MRNPFSRKNLFQTEEEELPVSLEVPIPEVDPDEQRFEDLYAPGEQQKALIEHLLAGSPDREDYKPGIGQALLAGIGGYAKALQGDPRGSSAFVEKVVSSPYRNAVEDHAAKTKELQGAATVEGMQRDDQRGLLGHRLNTKKLAAREASDLARADTAEKKMDLRHEEVLANQGIANRNAATAEKNANTRMTMAENILTAAQQRDVNNDKKSKEAARKDRKILYGRALREYNDLEKPFRNTQMQLQAVIDLATNRDPNGVTDLNILMRHIKSVDDSRASEGEVRVARQEAQSFTDRVRTAVDKFSDGKAVSNKVIQNIVEDAKVVMKSREKMLDDMKREQRFRAAEMGIPDRAFGGKITMNAEGDLEEMQDEAALVEDWMSGSKRGGYTDFVRK